MGRINYWAIEQQIAAVITASVSNITVLIEEELTFNRGSIVGIYLDDRDAPDDVQSLSAGTRTRMDINYTIWCWNFGLGKNIRPIMEARDDLIGNVEIALMGNRNLNNTVESSFLRGGEFLSGPEPEGTTFMAGASILLTVDAIAVV